MHLVEHHSSLVSALPQPRQKLSPLTVPAGDAALDSSHSSPQRIALRPNHDVVVIAHQAPSQDLKPVKPFDVGHDIDEIARLVRFRKDHLTRSRSAIHVVNGVWDEQTG